MAVRKRVILVFVGPCGFFQISPPVGLLYIAAWLRERFDLDIRIINQRVEGWSSERLVKESIAFKPHFMGLSSMTPLPMPCWELHR